MNIIIVGHGPSLIGKKLGGVIDSYDLVVRLKGSASVLGTEDYGKRCDVLCMSTEVVGLGYIAKPEVFWLYPKKGDYDRVAIGTFVGGCERPVLLPLGMFRDWNKSFVERGAKHPNVSTGMAAIMIAGIYMSPETIVLAGFDSLVNPEVPFTRNNAIPRTGTGVITHDWEIENVFLKELSESYGFTVSTL